MAVQSLVISASSSPAVVAGSFTLPTGPFHGFIRCHIKPLAGTAYLGNSSVTTADGYQLSTADAPLEINLQQSETLWIASSSGATVTVSVLRVNETT